MGIYYLSWIIAKFNADGKVQECTGGISDCMGIARDAARNLTGHLYLIFFLSYRFCKILDSVRSK
jgi:hypothetical protein